LFTSGVTGTDVALAAWLIPSGALINLDLAIIRAGGRVVGAYAPSLVVRPMLILLAATVTWLVWKRLSAETGLAISLGAFLVVALVQSRLVQEVLARGRRPQAVAYETRRWLQVSAPLFLVAGFQIALSQTDVLLVGSVGGVRYAGLYSAASKTAGLVGYLLIALLAVAAPLFAELEANGDRAGLQRLASACAQWVFWPTLAIAVVLAALAPYVLGLFGRDFLAARGALLILLVGQLANAGYGAVGALLNMTGHQNDMARVYGIVSVLNVVVCYAGVRAFGLNGAACATTISLIAWNVWLHRLTIRRIGVRASIIAALWPKRAGRTAA
jgi:O-antigen/teichoic acid export membrane protein